MALTTFALPIQAIAKPVKIVLEAGANQQIVMISGSQVVSSRLPSSYVMMTAPEPFDASRVQVNFVFGNRFSQPVNVGPENVSGSLAVVTYDQLIAEQDRRDKSSALVAALGALGNSLTAAERNGYREVQQARAGFQSCGFSCVTPYATTETVRVYDPALARKAQAEAEAENSSRFKEIDAESQLARSRIAINLRTTTVMPGQVLSGTLTFAVPKHVRKSKATQPLALYVRVGTDIHVIQGKVGPVGAPSMAAMPQPSTAKSVMRTKPAGSNSTVPLDSSVSIEAYRRGEYKNTLGNVMLLAEKGYFEAQYGLGYAYLYGINSEPKQPEAIRWLTAASDRGSSEASYQLGLYYETSPMHKDLSLSQQFYQVAADRGNAHAATVLSLKAKLAPNDARTFLPRPPAPANSAGQWFTVSDYPGLSAVSGKGGITSFRVTVSPTGGVLRCAITVSSGEKDLDDRTCALISSRSLFYPAKDASGRAIEGTYQNRVRWVPPAP